MYQKTLTIRIIGFVASLLLTLVAFLIVVSPEVLHLGNKWAIVVIFNLAILQSIVQAVFFLNLLTEKRPRWNLVFFLSTLSMIFVIIFFSICIMNHLNYNMMI